MSRVDVAILGAGPAGASAAIFLSKAGRRVVLIDRARFPRAKACGEGVMPPGLEVLREMGLADPVHAAGRPYRGIRFTALDGSRASGRFPEEDHGVVIRRETLDLLLLDRAKASPGVRVLESRTDARPIIEDGRLTALKTEQDGEIRADFFLVADGAASQTARRLGAPRIHPRRARFGLRTHFRDVQGSEEFVDVYLLHEGEIYVAPQPDGTALVSLLLEQKAMRRFSEDATERAFMETLRSCAPVVERLAQAERISPILGAGPLGGHARRCAGPNWLLVGDAASSVDPITGEGVSLALLGGKLAAEQIVSGRGPNGYAGRRSRLVWRKRVLSAALLSLSGRPRLSNLAIHWLSRRPAAFDLILSIC